MTEEFIDTAKAAHRMAEALDPGDTEAPRRWERFLRNNANQARKVASRIPVQKIGGRTVYRARDIADAMEIEKLRRIGTTTLSRRAAEALSAFGVGKGGSFTGHPWMGASIVDAIDEATGMPFVQMTIGEPRLTVYRLEMNQALELARGLAQAHKDAEAHAQRLKCN